MKISRKLNVLNLRFLKIKNPLKKHIKILDVALKICLKHVGDIFVLKPFSQGLFLLLLKTQF